MNYFDRIHYDPVTGQFTWAISARGVVKGKPAGTIDREGYRVVKLGRKPYRAGRLAWFLVHGAWPIGSIDHINGNRADDRLCNLRDVPHELNMQNKRVAMRNNRSCGLLGVTWNKQHHRWQSKLMVNKVFHHVGLFDSAEEAHEAYVLKKRQLQPGCTI